MLWFLFFLFYSSIKADIISVTQTEAEPTVDLTNDKNILSVIMEQCSCDFVKGVCEPYCCCDNDCDENLRESWTIEEKCIDEETTAKIQSYHCINRKLLFQYNKRRGIQEDKNDEKKTCYSKDNDESGDNLIENLSKKDSTELQNLKDSIYTNFKKQIEKKQSIPFSPSGSSNYFIYTTFAESNPFVIDNVFSLLKRNEYGVCAEGKSIRFYEYIPRYTCSNKNLLYKITVGNFKSYSIKPGATGSIIIDYLFVYTHNDDDHPISLVKVGDNSDTTYDNYVIKEFDFLIEITETQENVTVTPGSISQVLVNLTIVQNSNNNELNKPARNNIALNTLAFSLRFKQSNNEDYQFSGNVGYLIGYPLKVAYIKSSVLYSYYDGFYIKGKKTNGRCRTNSNPTDGDVLNKYPLDSDKPLLFGIDSEYTCTYLEAPCSNVVELIKTHIIYQNAFYIQLIGRVGSARLNATLDWKDVDQTGLGSIPLSESTNNGSYTYCSYSKGITLTIAYYETGPENDKQNMIKEAKIEFDEPTQEIEKYNKTFSFKVKYVKLSSSSVDNILTAKEETPTIMPRLPKDLIDPITKPES